MADSSNRDGASTSDGPDETSREESGDFTERILRGCLDGPVDSWHSALDAACVAHPDHEDELRRRFAFLEQAGMLEEAGTGTERPSTPWLTLSAESPQVFGGFDLEAVLGRGGMGVVYRARQRSTGRTVALKLIRPELLGIAKARVRFQREVECVSRLEHATICTVYEAGEHEGMPFVAMRLVEGPTLSELLSGDVQADDSQGEPLNAKAGTSSSDSHLTSAFLRGTTTTKRSVLATVAMFETLARGVHAAHEGGVLHRDIKPGNLMIDSQGDPVILDFGLARLEELVGSSLTVSGDALGTPAYMAPEQISPSRSRGDGPDRRSDVYSLAVTLYECLSRKHPFDASTRDELYRKILAGRAPELRRLSKHVPKDLSTVVAIAMHVDPNQRYETAEAFAEDLRRVRRLEPISARKTAAPVRFARWCRREPLLAGFVAALIAGVGVSTYFAIRANNNLERSLESERTTKFFANQANNSLVKSVESEKRAVTEAERSRQEAITAQRVTDFLVGLFEVADRSTHRGETITAKEVLDQGTREIARSLQDEPEIRARLMMTMGKVHENLGQFEDAQRMYSDSLALRRNLLDGVPKRPGSSSDQLVLAETLAALGEVAHFQDRFGEAEALYREGRTVSEAAHPGDHALTAKCIDLIGRARRDLGKLDEAGEFHQAALEMRTRLFGTEHPDLAESHQSLGMLAIWRADFDTGRVEIDRAIAIRERLLGPESGRIPELLGSRAYIAFHSETYEEAQRRGKEALERTRIIFGPVHQGIGHCASLLGTIAADNKRLKEATAHYEEALAVFRKIEGEDSAEVATQIHNLATVARDEQRWDDAFRMLDEALAIRLRLFGENDSSVATSRFTIALTRAWNGEHEQALPSFFAAYAIREPILGNDHPLTQRVLQYLVQSLEATESPDLAKWKAKLVE